MKLQTLACVLLANCLCSCRTHQTTIFVEQSLNRQYAQIACNMYKRNRNIACQRTPEQITTDLEARLTSAVRQNPACKYVTISYTPVNEENMKGYLAGWSLTFDLGIDDREIDYSSSAWHMLDHKTKKRFDGPLTNSSEAATQICTVATQ